MSTVIQSSGQRRVVQGGCVSSRVKIRTGRTGPRAFWGGKNDGCGTSQSATVARMRLGCEMRDARPSARRANAVSICTEAAKSTYWRGRPRVQRVGVGGDKSDVNAPLGPLASRKGRSRSLETQLIWGKRYKGPAICGFTKKATIRQAQSVDRLICGRFFKISLAEAGSAPDTMALAIRSTREKKRGLGGVR
jgi:hypothetical protein